MQDAKVRFFLETSRACSQTCSHRIDAARGQTICSYTCTRRLLSFALAALRVTRLSA